MQYVAPILPSSLLPGPAMEATGGPKNQVMHFISPPAQQLPSTEQDMSCCATVTGNGPVHVRQPGMSLLYKCLAAHTIIPMTAHDEAKECSTFVPVLAINDPALHPTA